MTDERYVPAAGRAIFTPLFDPAVAVTLRERQWRPDLIRAVSASVPGGGTVIDVGAGTGTLSIELAKLRPDASVVAVDGDPAVLDIARAKAGADLVDWREGMADQLPAPAGEANAVVMSMLLHHLVPTTKRAAFEEARRVLRPDGCLLVADFGRPRGALPRAGFAVLRVLDGRENTAEHGAGLLQERIGAAGFSTPRIWKRLATAWGTVELMTAWPAS